MVAQSLVEGGVESDFGFQEAGYRAADLGAVGDFGELRGVDAGDLGGGLEVDFRHGPAGVGEVLQGDRGVGGDALGSKAGFAEFGGEGHAEATGVGRGDQFLGIGARAVLETGAERIRGVLEDVAVSGKGAATRLEVAAPNGEGFAFHR